MQNAKHNFVLRLLPSFTDLAFLMPLVFLFSRLDGVPGMLGDGDTGWHIRAGEWMLQNGSVPRTDIFSFTMPDQPWYAWEWLWDVMFAWLHLQWGMGAVVFASVLVICVTFGLLFRVAYRLSGHPLVAIGLTVLAAAASTIHWLARPHLFTMLFLVIFMDLIIRAADGRMRLLVWLPALTVLWANIHGGFLAGITILFAYGAGHLVSAVLAPEAESRAELWKRGGLFLLAGVGCLAASLVNPYGYELHVHIWKYLREPEMTQAIIEFQGTNFQNGRAGYFEVLLAISCGAAIWYGRQRRFAEVFALAGWGHLALLVVRNVPLFGLVATPLLAPAISAWIVSLRNAPIAAWVRGLATEITELGDEFAPMERIQRFHIVSMAAVVLVAFLMSRPEPTRLWNAEYDTKSYPAAALPMLDASQRIFTHDEWGDYLIYRLWSSGVKVYVDGRSDFYGSKFDKEYIELINGRFDWEKTLAKYGVDTILLPPRQGLATTIKESRNWRVAFDNGNAILFQRVEPAETVGRDSTPQGGGWRGGSPTVAPKNVTQRGHGNSKGAEPL